MSSKANNNSNNSSTNSHSSSSSSSRRSSKSNLEMDKRGDDSGNEKEREDTRDMILPTVRSFGGNHELVAAIAKSNHQSKEQYLSTGIPVSRYPLVA